jgi:type VI secretion system protein ImpM
VAQTYVDTRQAEWVEESIGQDYGVQKLSSYLQQDGLSLQQAGKTFNETFLGS